MHLSLPQNPLVVLANVLTNVGKQIVTNSVKRPLPGSGIGANEPLHIAWGSGAGTALITDTTLFTEEAEARTTGTSSLVTTTTTNDTYQVQGTMTAIANKSITNAGLFDVTKAQSGAVTGNLFAKGDFTAIPLSTGDSIAFTFRWQLQ